VSCSARLPVCPALSGAPSALQQLQNELQELQPAIVLAGKSDRELRRMRKNLRDVSSADDDEESYLDEEEQEEEPAPKSRKRKKKGELRSSIPDDAPPPVKISFAATPPLPPLCCRVPVGEGGGGWQK
jgi:hypothetical protein